MRRVVMVILDGLRPDFVTDATTPNLVRFAAQAERFGAFRSAFPSATRVVSATFATGCFPARHTLQGNAVALLENGVLVPHDVGRPDFLQHKRAVTGHSLAVPTLAERLAPHGGAVVFNNVSPGLRGRMIRTGSGWSIIARSRWVPAWCRRPIRCV